MSTVGRAPNLARGPLAGRVKYRMKDRTKDRTKDGEYVPQVSVIISTFNRRRMLTRALHSALNQRGVDLEVLVVDNGSTDDTRQYLAGYTDRRLRVIRNETSLGSVGGRNTGLAQATGQWVGMLDDDDLWAPDKLREQVRSIHRTGRLWAYAGCVHIDGQDRILGGRPTPPPTKVMAQMPRRFLLPGGMSNIIWRRGALDGDGLLDPDLPFPADWDVSLRLARAGLPAEVARPLVAYRQHGSNMSRDSAHYLDQLELFERKHPEVGDRGIDWGAQWRFVGSEELRAGARGAALQAFARAVAAGDLGSAPRAAATLLPEPAQRWLLRSVLSNRAWLDEGQRWLDAIREPQNDEHVHGTSAA